MRDRIVIAASVIALILASWLLFAADEVASPCATQSFEGDAFTVCRYRAGDDVKLVWADGQGGALRSFERLAASGVIDPKRVRFAMNAGMYDDVGAPIGLFVANGREEHALNRKTGSGNFHMQPNGVFFIDVSGRAQILTTADFASAAPSAELATQSGPMLVVGGAINAAFSQDGPSRNVRNGVGICSGGTLFAISEGKVSFGKFARFFRDALGCGDALYLDGSVSSLWVPIIGRRDDNYALGPMIVISERAKP